MKATIDPADIARQVQDARLAVVPSEVMTMTPVSLAAPLSREYSTLKFSLLATATEKTLAVVLFRMSVVFMELSSQ